MRLCQSQSYAQSYASETQRWNVAVSIAVDNMSAMWQQVPVENKQTSHVSPGSIASYHSVQGFDQQPFQPHPAEIYNIQSDIR